MNSEASDMCSGKEASASKSSRSSRPVARFKLKSASGASASRPRSSGANCSSSSTASEPRSSSA
eukprot:77653-Pleurochrysis_carterae.AAC.1